MILARNVATCLARHLLKLGVADIIGMKVVSRIFAIS